MNTMPEFLRTEEAADLRHVHANTIKRWIKDGHLPVSRIGREYRIPRAAIENRTSRAAAGTRVIAVANQKGGVAKTTTTLMMAAGLAFHGRRVPVVDLDPQGGCAVSPGIPTVRLAPVWFS